MPVNDHHPHEMNRLLAALPAAEYARFAERFELVSLVAQQTLYVPPKPVSHVYFPRNGVISLLRDMADGNVVEVGTVGSEGMIGTGVVLDHAQVMLRPMCQVPCNAVRIRSEDFKRLFSQSPVLRGLVYRYAQATAVLFTQAIACNRLHTVEQRLATWLLLAADHVRANTFELKQELIALMLGVRRASVTVAARTFQQAELIQYRRAQISIINSRGLQARACECYRVIAAAFRRVIAQR